MLAAALFLLADDKVDYERQIKPIFQATCVKCHGPEKQKAGLRLDSGEAVLKGAKGGKVVVPGKPEESSMVKRISLPPSDDDFMPSEGDPLKKEQIELIKRWIAQGAVISGSSPAPGADPQLNAPPAGFTALFNGKDLTGWQGLVTVKERAKIPPEQLAARQKRANEKVLPHWTVRDGLLHYDGKGDNLQTAKDYTDIELWVDWKIGPKGDSGIYLRGNPQVQIWDHTKNPVGSGGLYNNKKHPKDPTSCADKPIGEWNRFHIIMKGDKVTVWLNEKKVVDEVPLENYWEPTKPLPSTGPIELQHHGDELWFRNIFVKEL